MRNSFGTFTTLQSEKDLMQSIFWSVLEYQVADKDSQNPKYKFLLISKADQIIRDLSCEPFQAYCKALELNGEGFHHQSFGYPASEVFFINPESVKEFHNALAVWQRKYNLCYTDENLNPLTFDEWFVYSHNDFYPNIAAYILKMSEKEAFQKFNKLSDGEKDKIRIKYIQSKKWIINGEQSTANFEVAVTFLESQKASYQAMPEEKLKNLKNKETDWIPKKVCEFLWHWADYPKDYEILFLHNSGGLTGFIDESAPQGFDEFAAHFETSEIYAEKMAKKAQGKINSDEMLSNAPKLAQRRFVESIKGKALKHAKEFQKSKLDKHLHLSTAKDLPSMEKHFTWLVETYILGKRFTELSDENSIEAISKATERIAEIIGLPKPAHLKKGRPKGSKNDPTTSKLGKN